MKVVQRLKKSAQDATTVTLVPSALVVEAKPTHLKSTQMVLTFVALPTELFGAALTDTREFLVTIEPVY